MTHFEKLELLWGLNVKGSDKLLMHALQFHIGDNEDCFPSLKSLARKLTVGEKQVRNIVGHLKSLGLIRVRRAKTNRYSIDWGVVKSSQLPAVQSGTPVPLSGRVNRNFSSTHNRNSSSTLRGHNRNPSSTKHPLKNTHKNTQKGGASKKPFSWTIKPEELMDHAKVESRFRHAVNYRWLQEAEQLRFHTLAVYVRQQKGIAKPGALMTSLLRDAKWKGGNADEDEAKAAIRSLTKTKANSNFGNLRAKFAVTVPEGVDDEPIC